ncbi:MAG: hypothetical protein RR494_07945 [Vagococcus sp.]|uniref:hypothetical protein n=1 Tax=Vagococcus sp. TaxID=1933889 RepID=UPI002FC640EB
MEITIKGSPQEIKELLQVIESNKEQQIDQINSIITQLSLLKTKVESIEAKLR